MEPRKSFLLRIDPMLWQELDQWAQEELRSVNGQIEYLLKTAVKQRKKKVTPETTVSQASTPAG